MSQTLGREGARRGTIAKPLKEGALENKAPAEDRGCVAETHTYLKRCVSKRYGPSLGDSLPRQEGFARSAVFEH